MSDAGARAARLSRKLKPVVWVAAALPAIRTALFLVLGRLGTNPIAEAMNELGLWTLVILLTSLACTPAKIVLGWKWPLQYRRMLGLWAFAYACLHFLTYLVLDQFFAWDEIWKDIIKRKF